MGGGPVVARANLLKQRLLHKFSRHRCGFRRRQVGHHLDLCKAHLTLWSALFPSGEVARDTPCRHVLVFGESGSGKTASAILPAVVAACDPNNRVGCALLIDLKQEIKDAVVELAGADLRVFEPGGRGSVRQAIGVMALPEWPIEDDLAADRVRTAARKILLRSASLAPASSAGTLNGTLARGRDPCWEVEGTKLARAVVATTLALFCSGNGASARVEHAGWRAPEMRRHALEPTMSWPCVPASAANAATTSGAICTSRRHWPPDGWRTKASRTPCWAIKTGFGTLPRPWCYPAQEIVQMDIRMTASNKLHSRLRQSPPTRLFGVFGFALTLLCCQAALAQAAEHEIPLFVSASNAMQQGFARIVNHSDDSGTVSIRAIDDSGREFEPFEISLDSWGVMHFNSDHLEMGDSSRGITGIGAGTGDWRLVLTSDLNIEVLAYVRTVDGFLTSMHDTVRKPGTRHLVPIFNPGSNSRQASRLRLVNPSESAAQVTITGVDDQGTRMSDVSLSVPAGEARSVTAKQLEMGHSSLTGRLGDGTGKWRLFVTSNRDIHVMSLLESATGHLTNLSASTSATDFPLPQEVDQSEDAYVQLEGLTVSPGRVQLFFISAGRCITLSNATLNGVRYTFKSSKWQKRADSNSDWADIPGTEEEGKLCSLNPSERGEYRLVAEITIDGETRMYASNVMVIK